MLGKISVRKVLYHHRTQGKAVEGVHIRGIPDALRPEGVHVDIISLPGADPYSSPKAMSPTKQARPWMGLIAKLPEPLFEPDGNITTLGRGGSDTSAVALAAALKADVCEILTDVDGVYTTDPRVEPRARKIPRITYEEMLELASLGAKVLQIRSVEFAMKYSVPVHVRSSLNDSEGTWIMSDQRNLESPVVTGVALDRNEAKLTLTNVPDVPGTVAAIFGQLARAGIVVDSVVVHPLGGMARLLWGAEDPRLEARVAAAGPATNLLLAAGRRTTVERPTRPRGILVRSTMENSRRRPFNWARRASTKDCRSLAA